MVPTSNPNVEKVSDNLHRLWMRTIMEPSSCCYCNSCWPRDFRCQSWNPGSLLGAKWSRCVLVEAPNPNQLYPTSTSNISKVFGNLHMLWMTIWNHHLATNTTLVGPDLEHQEVKSWITAWCQMKLLYIGWGSKPIWTLTHIYSKHMQGVWQPSYAVDNIMEQSSCH